MTDEETIARIAFDLLALAYADLAAAVRERRPPGTAVFNEIEQGVARRLVAFRATLDPGAADPILAAVAQRVGMAVRRAHGARDATTGPH